MILVGGGADVADLLLELFSEEIPARMQADAASHLGAALEKALGAKVKTFVTPRRLAAIIEHLPEKQPDLNEELKGPKVGAPEAAMAGFLKKTGLTLAHLEVRDGVYFAKIEQKGRATAEVLKEVIEKILAEFPWPKSMRWGSGETSWVRPLHSILCLFDGTVVPIEFAGVKANNFTFGHRFLAPEKIIITDAKQYESALEKAHVIADRDKRKAVIAKQLEEKCASLKVVLHADAGLLEEVTGLVEWPNILSGQINASHMDLPEEVLILEMKNHQKYLATREPSPSGRGRGEGPHPNLLPKGEGALSPHFLITSNMVTADGGKAIIAGNERVLRARFADGRFFWDQDRNTKLEDFATKLKDITYHAKLGSVADKVIRVSALASSLRGALATKQSSTGSPHDFIARDDDIERAVQLSKADLVSGMVGEFPELQGVMGRYYALSQGEKQEVADAIRDHYKPQGPSDSVPTAAVSICVALADKLDTLLSMFAIGEKPTGSKDPFALRRAALGVIRIVLENNLRLPLRAVIPEDVRDDMLSFLHERLNVQMKDQGIPHDVIAAVVAGGDDDLLRIVARARALQDFLDTEDGANLLAAYRRAANILGMEEKKDGTAYLATQIDHAALSTPEEKALVDALSRVSSIVDECMNAEKFSNAMQHMAELRGPVDAFFEHTMVNADDKKIRANRLRMLGAIRAAMTTMADFGKIQHPLK